MRSSKTVVQSVLRAVDFPRELWTGAPVIEITGDAEATVIHHRGIIAYAPEELCVASSLGCVRIRGRDLRLGRMNRERILIYGKVSRVDVGEQTP